ncbi:MAG: SsrA-binding protein SmpB [Bacteroidetes bacterium]|nr:SsrA-binding protein SmpB [Bacteroidota bacterium]
MATTPVQIRIKNKKAWYEYLLLEDFVAGIVLTGTEIKSIREGKVNLTDSYCTFDSNELFVLNMHIAEYKYGNQFNHEPKRPRKLLLKRRELNKIQGKARDKGVTVVPTELYINEEGLAKLNIHIARGKKTYDKRESLKNKDQKREIERRHEE